MCVRHAAVDRHTQPGRQPGSSLRGSVCIPATRGFGMDRKLTVAVALWLSGFVAGVILVARWRRMGENPVVTAPPEPVVEDSSTTSAGKVQRTAQRLAGPIVAGAKADLIMVRNATRHASNRVVSTVGVGDTAPGGLNPTRHSSADLGGALRRAPRCTGHVNLAAPVDRCAPDRAFGASRSGWFGRAVRIRAEGQDDLSTIRREGVGATCRRARFRTASRTNLVRR